MNKLRFVVIVILSSLLLISGKFYPALGKGEAVSGQIPLNGALYKFHTGQQIGELLSEKSCLACHPGPHLGSSSNVFATLGIGCLDCHSGMASMNTPPNIQGVTLLSCSSCHDRDPESAQTSCVAQPGGTIPTNGSKLLIKLKTENAAVPYCTASVSTVNASNSTLGGEVSVFQNLGYIGSIVSCSACHASTLQESFGHFGTKQ